MLEGIRVVELSIWVAGPAAGALLADWGADVIKVEPPRGDPMRNMFGALGVAGITDPPPYDVDNRGKRSVALDLTTEGDRARLDQLLDTADVFLTNVRVDALERLGLGTDAVRQRFPRLIYAVLTGYGMSGPDKDRPGYDVGAFWARSSLAHSIVPPTEAPPALNTALGDHATGITLAAGILAGLLNREKTGEGRLVTTSLLRTGIYLNSSDISIKQNLGRLQSTRDRAHRKTPLLNNYFGADGKGFWLIGVEQDRHWPGLLRALDRPDLGEDERFIKATDRAKNCEQLIAALDEVFREQTRDYWTERFDAQDVWWAPINSVADVLEDPQAIASGAFIQRSIGDGNTLPSVATPVEFSDFPLRFGLVARVGEHTDEVFRDLSK